VVLTRHDKAAEKVTGTEKVVSETILSNVLVLAVDQALDEKAGTKVAIGKTATLEVTEAQAQTLALSKQVGTISLALRSILDSASPAAGGGEDNKDKDSPINTVRFGVSSTGSIH